MENREYVIGKKKKKHTNLHEKPTRKSHVEEKKIHYIKKLVQKMRDMNDYYISSNIPLLRP